MIRYAPHNEIDKKKWDSCIMKSHNGLVYGCSWYLDSFSPGWDAIIEDDYISVMPLPKRKKYGFNYIYRPAFTQQLGVFSEELINEKKLSEFLNEIPDQFKYVNFGANYACNHLIPGYSFGINKNFELNIKSKSHDEIYRNYSSNHKRNIKKAQSYNLLSKQSTLDELISFKLNNNEKHVKVREENLAEFIKMAQKAIEISCGEVISVYSEENVLLASVFLTIFKGRVTYLLPVSSIDGKEKRAMFFLIDEYIKFHISQSAILDFEGSNIPNVAAFYEGFGALPVLYPTIIINRLPWYVRFLK